MNDLSRRTLLRGLGACVAMPWMETFAAIQPAKSPTRIAFLFVPNGISMEHWRPGSAGALGELPSVLSPLESLKGQFNILTGLAQRNAFALGDGPGDHARSAAVWLTGVHPLKTSGANIQAGMSVDQIAAKALGKDTKFASLELGCERGGLAGDCDSGYSCAYSNAISWSGPATPVAKETNPRLVFERLFGSGDESADAQSRALRQKNRLSILDFVLSEADDLNRKLSKNDQRKLDEYMSALREIELRLQKFEAESLKSGTALKPVLRPTDFGEHIRLMGDMMILAFRTDMTRICTFMLANEGSNRPYREIGISEGHHEISHHGLEAKKMEMKRQIDHFHVQQLAYILHQMAQVKEADGSLLDNTLLVYGGGISDGNRHNHDDLPILVAGKGGSRLRTGQHVVYEKGQPMNNLLVSMLDRMGLPGEKFGDATGPLGGLF